MKTIAIIGAGFSGVATAIHLLRWAAHDIDVILIERRDNKIGGLAYGKAQAEHLLNVPAKNLSLFEDIPQDFVAFLSALGLGLTPDCYAPRRLYGDYLEQRLNAAERAARPGARLLRVSGEACRIERLGLRESAHVVLDDDRHILADKVVLALGHMPAVAPPGASLRLLKSARYLANPWDASRLASIHGREPILILGTGLTSVDATASLVRMNPDRRIIAISRHGLLPQSHSSAMPPGEQPLALDTPLRPERLQSVRALLRELRSTAGRLTASGGDWRDAVAQLRPITPQVWQGWAQPDQRRFLRHAQTYWDVHRHRMAPEIHQRYLDAKATGALTVIAARALELDLSGDAVQARLCSRGDNRVISLRASHVINCTGGRFQRDCGSDRLFTDLMSTGLIREDRHGIGLDVASNGAVVDTIGRASTQLFYVGPYLKARYWEATAIPELRRYACSLARTLLDD